MYDFSKRIAVITGAGKGIGKDIAKRFLISEFNDIKEQYSLDKAFEVFNSITPNDKEAMFNERKNLDEKLVREKVQAIISRLDNND